MWFFLLLFLHGSNSLQLSFVPQCWQQQAWPVCRRLSVSWLGVRIMKLDDMRIGSEMVGEYFKRICTYENIMHISHGLLITYIDGVSVDDVILYIYICLCQSIVSTILMNYTIETYIWKQSGKNNSIISSNTSSWPHQLLVCMSPRKSLL